MHRKPDECYGRAKSGVGMLSALGWSCAVLLRNHMQAVLVHAASQGSGRARHKATTGTGLQVRMGTRLGRETVVRLEQLD